VGDDDYTRKYPDDDYGEEMGPDSRVWKTYIDEAEIADKEYISDNNATLDGILVFVCTQILFQAMALAANQCHDTLRHLSSQPL